MAMRRQRASRSLAIARSGMRIRLGPAPQDTGLGRPRGRDRKRRQPQRPRGRERLRGERPRGHNPVTSTRLNEPEQPDHSASLSDFIMSSTQISFSVHTEANPVDLW